MVLLPFFLISDKLYMTTSQHYKSVIGKRSDLLASYPLYLSMKAPFLFENSFPQGMKHKIRFIFSAPASPRTS